MDSINDVSSTGGLRNPDGEVRVVALSAPYFYTATGGVVVSGPRHWELDTDYNVIGGVVCTGTANVETGFYHHTATGGVAVSGVNYAIDFCYTAAGGVTLAGSVTIPGNAYTNDGTGGIEVRGSPAVSVPHRTTSMSGGIGVAAPGTGHADTHITVGSHAYFYYLSYSSYNINVSGQFGIATSAPPTYAYTSDSGVDVAGAATSFTTGLPGGRFPYVGTGGLGLAGVAVVPPPHVSPQDSGHGGASVAGVAGSRVTFRYNGLGNLFVGGYGETPATSEIILDQTFEWNVLAELDIDQQFEWGFGAAVLYWFQVESCCEPTVCDSFIVDDGGKCNNTTFMKTLLAPDVADVCRQLTTQGITSRICSIKKFSRAAYFADQNLLTQQGIDQKCNHIFELEYCHIPACLELCLDYDVTIHVGGNFTTAQRGIASGGVVVFGSASYANVFGVVDVDTGGGATVGGSASVLSQQYGIDAEGVISVGGESYATAISRQWFYTAVGGIQIGSPSAENQSSAYTWSGSGGVGLSGTGGGGTAFEFAPSGVGDNSSFTSVEVDGEADCVGPASPVWNWTGTGLVVLGGTPTLNWFTYEGSGGVALEGAPQTGRGQWDWSNNLYDGVVTGGDAVYSQGLSGVLPGGFAAVEFGGFGFGGLVSYPEVLPPRPPIDPSFYDDLSGELLLASPGTIKTECDCNAINAVIQMRHNFASASKLQGFLNRNHIDLPSVINMSYNSVYKSWQTNLHMQGFSENASSLETWSAVFEWQCTQFVGGTDLGSPVWKLGAYFAVKNSTGENSDTRVLLTFSKLGPCQNGLISFLIDVNTHTNVITTDPRHQVNGALIHDGIGMFRSLSWSKNPHVSILISEGDVETSTSRIPYQPIFPEI